MMLFTLIAFGALHAFGMYGDTCRCVYVRIPIFNAVIRVPGTKGSCVLPQHRECVYSSQAKTCVCQNIHNGDSNPPPFVATRRNGMIIHGSVGRPTGVSGGTPSVGTIIQQPVVLPAPILPSVSGSESSDEFTDIFAIPTACANAHTHYEGRRLSDTGRDASVYGAVHCVGGRVRTPGVKCRARRLDLNDYALNVPENGNKWVDLDKYLSEIARDGIPGKPEVCRLATDCQVLDRYEAVCNGMGQDSCKSVDFCYWGNYGERRL